MAAPYVYDKAKYHYGGDYPEGLPEEQAFVHTGMFLGWVIDHHLYDPDFWQDDAETTLQQLLLETISTLEVS